MPLAAVDGGEIGHAQALQTMACRMELTTDMNPILLKLQSDCESQIIVKGRPCGKLEASRFLEDRTPLLKLALDSYHRLENTCDLVVAEGAGSPAETNLRARDIMNMGFARAANLPVILVGDISRGGVIASIVGIKAVLEPADAAAIRGFIIDLFRGDLSLFDRGIKTIEEMTHWQSFGIVPWLPAARRLPSEDSIVPMERHGQGATIAVPVLPHISSFDDFDALAAEEKVNLLYVYPGCPIPAQADMIIIPGTKTTISDLEFFRNQGWDIDLKAHIRRGGYVLESAEDIRCWGFPFAILWEWRDRRKRFVDWAFFRYTQSLMRKNMLDRWRESACVMRSRFGDTKFIMVVHGWSNTHSLFCV